MSNVKSFFCTIFLIIFLFGFSSPCFAKIEITDYPHQVEINKEFIVGVSLTNISDSHYIGIAVHKKAGDEYFGLTKNGGDWVEMENNNCANLPLVAVEDSWSGDLTGKVVYGEKGFDGSLGDYILKVVKYTFNACNDGKSNSYSGGVMITLTDPSSSPTPSPSPSPSSSPSPSPTSSSTTATYKINEVKDEDGNTLSSVKIYVDGVYLHHYAPETLTFCDDCQCDDLVACGFSEHTIKLEKTGFQDWTETKTINAGDSFEVNPVMSLLSAEVSPSPSSSPISTASALPVIPSDSETASSEEMLSEKEAFTGEVLGKEEKKAEKEEKKEEKQSLGGLPFVLILGGIMLLFAANFQILKPKIQDIIELIKYKAKL